VRKWERSNPRWQPRLWGEMTTPPHEQYWWDNQNRQWGTNFYSKCLKLNVFHAAVIPNFISTQVVWVSCLTPRPLWPNEA
jgi:hypothetical protein